MITFEEKDKSLVIPSNLGNFAGTGEGGYDEGYNDGVKDQKAKLRGLSVTENGRYTREDGYNEVIVDVDIPSPEPVLQDKSVLLKDDVEYVYPDTGYDGLSSVEIDAINVWTRGHTEGELDQKNKLATGTFTENGDYYREDGWRNVIVRVPQESDADDYRTVTITYNVGSVNTNVRLLYQFSRTQFVGWVEKAYVDGNEATFSFVREDIQYSFDTAGTHVVKLVLNKGVHSADWRYYTTWSGTTCRITKIEYPHYWSGSYKNDDTTSAEVVAHTYNITPYTAVADGAAASGTLYYPTGCDYSELQTRLPGWTLIADI